MDASIWYKILSEGKMENKLEIRCQCGDYGNDHLVTLSLHKEFGEVTLLIGTGLNHYLGFWKRLGVGLKYILGIDNTYHSHVECLIECPSQVKDLKSFVDEVAEKFGVTSEVNDKGDSTFNFDLDSGVVSSLSKTSGKTQED